MEQQQHFSFIQSHGIPLLVDTKNDCCLEPSRGFHYRSRSMQQVSALAKVMTRVGSCRGLKKNVLKKANNKRGPGELLVICNHRYADPARGLSGGRLVFWGLTTVHGCRRAAGRYYGRYKALRSHTTLVTRFSTDIRHLLPCLGRCCTCVWVVFLDR